MAVASLIFFVVFMVSTRLAPSTSEDLCISSCSDKAQVCLNMCEDEAECKLCSTSLENCYASCPSMGLLKRYLFVLLITLPIVSDSEQRY